MKENAMDNDKGQELNRTIGDNNFYDLGNVPPVYVTIDWSQKKQWDCVTISRNEIGTGTNGIVLVVEYAKRKGVVLEWLEFDDFVKFYVSSSVIESYAWTYSVEKMQVLKNEVLEDIKACFPDGCASTVIRKHRSNIAYNIIKNALDLLITDGLIKKRVITGGRGRPAFEYVYNGKREDDGHEYNGHQDHHGMETQEIASAYHYQLKSADTNAGAGAGADAADGLLVPTKSAAQLLQCMQRGTKAEGEPPAVHYTFTGTNQEAAPILPCRNVVVCDGIPAPDAEAAPTPTPAAAEGDAFNPFDVCEQKIKEAEGVDDFDPFATEGLFIGKYAAASNSGAESE